MGLYSKHFYSLVKTLLIACNQVFKSMGQFELVKMVNWIHYSGKFYFPGLQKNNAKYVFLLLNDRNRICSLL